MPYARSNAMSKPPRPPAARRAGAAAALAVAATLAVGTGDARAGVVVHEASFAAEVGAAGVFVGAVERRLRAIDLGELPRFDAALGTLTGVGFSFTSSVDAWLYGRAEDTRAEADFFPLPPFITNERNDTGLGAGWRIDLGLAIFDPGGLGPGASRSFALDGSCGERVSSAAAVECTFIRRLEAGLGAGVDVSAAPLSAFVGSDPVNFFAEVDARLAGLCDADDDGDLCSFEPLTSVRWSGTARIEYRYDAAPGPGGDGEPPSPSPVPAPASLALAVLGLALVRAANVHPRGRRFAAEPPVGEPACPATSSNVPSRNAWPFPSMPTAARRWTA